MPISRKMLSFPPLIFTFFCFLLSFHSSEAFVYTCNEIKYNLVPNNLSISTQFACIVHQSNVKINFDDEQFDGDNVRDLFLVNDEDGERFNFIDIANSTEHCLTGGPWRVESDAPIDELDSGSKEVTLLFSSVLPNIFIPKTLGEDLDDDMFTDDGVTVVSPNGGINFDMFFLGENATGSLDFYAGVGAGEEEEMVLLRTQEYTSDDDEDVNLYHLGPVATVKMRTPFIFSFIVSGITGSYEFSYSPVGFEVISSGAVSVLQSTQNERIQINYGLGAIVTLTGTVIFDPEVHSSIAVSCTDYDDVVWGAIEFANSGDINWSSQCRFLDFNYTGSLPKEETWRRSSERIDLSLTAVGLPTTAAPETTVETTMPTSKASTTMKARRTTPKASSTMRPSTTTRTTAASSSSTTTTVQTTTSSRAEIGAPIATIFALILASLH